ncbi:MAG: sigma-70 family RNA polymerase sigma factor, partial [Candidatus Caldarchaeum sp.]
MSTPAEEFERVITEYEKRLYNVALRLTGDPETAFELTHETFIRAFRAWQRFRGDSSVYTWLYKIMINLNKDKIAREIRRREYEVPLEPSPMEEGQIERVSPAPSPHEVAETHELRELLTEAVESLPPSYRECLVLREVDGLSYEEIASVMGISVEAVRSRLARA